MAAPCCSRRPSACTAWSRQWARCLADARAPSKIRPTLEDLIGQRVFAIACGHPDGNDADRLADDPIHKLLLGRDLVAGAPLASQPTISRFENGVGRAALYTMPRELAACVIARHRRRLGGRVRRVTTDLDPTDDATHGAQQLTFFNGHYDAWCYLPLLAFVTFDREAEQYLCAAVLRPGNVPASRGTVGVLARLLPLLRCAFPRARLLVRLGRRFCHPGGLRLPRRRTAGRLRGGNGEEQGVAAAGRVCPAGRGPKARPVARPRTSTPTPATRRRRGQTPAGS